MTPYMKNIDYAKVGSFAAEVNYQPGQIVSKTLAQNPAVSLTLFAFAKGEEIGTHTSTGDAMALVLDGQGQITVGEQTFILQAGETIVMPAETPMRSTPKKRLRCF